jgi:hypothetical protein
MFGGIINILWVRYVGEGGVVVEGAFIGWGVGFDL